MHIAPFGNFIKDEENDWLISPPLALPLFDQVDCEFLLEGYETDSQQAEFVSAIQNFLSLDQSALKAAQDAIFHYYLDCSRLAKADGLHCVEIAAPQDVWQHIQPGWEALVCRRQTGDQAVYVLFECDCDWNEEEGLQLVFKNGLQICKVGPFDDFLSYADVYGLPELDKVLYQSRG